MRKPRNVRRRKRESSPAPARLLTGPQWFQARFRRAGEAHYAALLRLAQESGIGLKTLYRAVVHERRVFSETVDRLENLAGPGVLDRVALLSAPRGQPEGKRGRWSRERHAAEAAERAG